MIYRKWSLLTGPAVLCGGVAAAALAVNFIFKQCALHGNTPYCFDLGKATSGVFGLEKIPSLNRQEKSKVRHHQASRTDVKR
ncbi:hypothetical protein Ccrd_006886 [Cynara cardunculus var. scolymus]|uniref:Uncharacterized protein n=1 Tax=Cynara cardunculus var. scolymus TaxID=59895 RepID=A0A118JU80_CYNCS|nr:hypothetical protein Ccrd_006886 [Cynara cardunculus var. scolymus]